jgi:broad specificity phosphatase PhoE
MTVTDGMQNIAGIVPDAWCVWRYGKAGKKPPFTHTGDMITTALKATQLCTFSEATAAYNETPANDGIGVFVRAPLVVIDLDKVITWNDDTPVFTDDAQAIMRAFTGAYMEYSPSRTGVHIYLRYVGDLSQTQWQNKNAQWPLPSGGGIEIFTGKTAHSHYITITGDSVSKHHGIIAIQQGEIDDLIAQYDPKATQRIDTPPQATMPVSDTPAPASMSPDTIDTPAPVAKARTHKQDRFISWAHSAWPGMMRDAIDEMASTPDGSRHDTRKRIGTTLGYAYRALEHACIAVGVPSGDAFAEYATHDAVIDAIYNARPVNDKSTAKDERHTIETAFTKAHAACGGWHQFSADPKALREIMALDNDAQASPFIDKPYTGHQTAPEAPQRTKRTQSPPQATTHDTAPANALIDFDAGTITPHQDIINNLRNTIEDAKRTGNDWARSALFTPVATMREHAKDKPRPVIASTESERHLLMPGVCQLAAASKAGKSTIALHFAHAVATGGDVFGSPSYHVHTPGTVVYFDLENAPGITGTRIDDTISTDAIPLHFITPQQWHSVLGIAYEQRRDRWSAMQWYISEALRLWPDARLLILDNVLQFQPRRQQHETPEDLEERYMMWLAGVAETYKGLCIMLVDHNTKAQATDNEAIMTSKAQGTFRKQALLSGGVLSVYNAPAKDSMPDGTLKLVTMMRACENTAIHIKRDDTRGHHTLVDVDPLPLSLVQRRIYEAIRAGNIRKPDIDNALPTMSAQHLANELNKMVAKGVIYRPRHGEYAISGASYTQTATESDAT